jgi:glycerol kinase
MAFQTRDVLEAMQQDSQVALQVLKVDGGAAVNDDLMQFQADLLATKVCRPVVSETTALGAAYLAGLAVGYWDDLQDVARNWAVDREFVPSMDEESRTRSYDRWKKAVARTLEWEEHPL